MFVWSLLLCPKRGTADRRLYMVVTIENLETGRFSVRVYESASSAYCLETRRRHRKHFEVCFYKGRDAEYIEERTWGK